MEKNKFKPENPVFLNEDRVSVDLTKSYLISMAVSLPSLALLAFFVKLEINWLAPQLWLVGILVLSLVNFIVLICLDNIRNRIGSLTLPTLIGTVGIVLLLVILKAFEEVFYFIDLKLLLPWVALFLIFCPLAIFKEKLIALKIHMGINSIALAVLWSLGNTGMIFLPF